MQADRFYSREDDGLAQPWVAKTVWLNPPYSAKGMERFVNKLEYEFKEARSFREALVITNNATETKWAQKLARMAHAVCFLSSRVAFKRINEFGEVWTPRSGTLQGQMMWYISDGSSSDSFEESFSRLGVCMREVAG